MTIYYNPNDSLLIEIRQWFKNNPISKQELASNSEQIIVPWNKNKTGLQKHSKETRKKNE